MNKGLRDNPRSMPTNDNYRNNYDAIFKKKDPAAPTTGDTQKGGTAPEAEAPGYENGPEFS